jgi:glycosyltransferase involved in cell wall biosynthesis
MTIEAMTMARPIIAPDYGGAVEMIENGKTGLLFRPGDAEDLAAKTRLLYRDPQLRSTMGQSARAQALKVFAISEHVTQVEGVYERILEVS